jgi:uncharacterized protein (TIGR02266 family)
MRLGPGGRVSANAFNFRILVADDSKFYQGLLREMLSEAGYEVHLASNGLECVDKARRELVDLSLIVLDVFMPGLDGFGVLKELKHDKKTAAIPVLAISGNYREHDAHELRRLGATGFLNKNLPLEEILFRINRILYPDKEAIRTNPRVVENILVRYTVDDSLFTGYSFNISTGGVFIRTVYPPPENTPVELRFTLPRSDKSIRALGTVVWRNEYRPEAPMAYPPGIGVKFTGIDHGDRRAITDHILSRLT